MQDFIRRAERVCRVHARFRVLWLVGPSRSGKSELCRAVAKQIGWRYINYTLDSGFLDALQGKEESYRPEDFLQLVHSICNNSTEQLIIIDEIEPLLGLWTRQTQDSFFRLVGRMEYIKCGVVLVTRLRSPAEMESLAPGRDHVFAIHSAGADR